MPYFSWTGINDNGAFCSGKDLSQSPNDLEHALARKNISLAQATVYRAYYSKSSRASLRSALINHLSALLSANIRLASALEIIASLMPEKKRKVIIQDLLFCVESGVPLSTALAYYPDFFDELTIAMIEIGESSGSLAQVCSSIAENDKEVAAFNRSINDATRTPLITLVFFLGILLVLFIKIVPYFALILERSGKSLPPLTRLFLAMSALVRSYMFWVVFLVSAFFLYALSRMARSFFGALKELCITHMPYLKGPITDWTVGIFLSALHILLSHRVPLITALQLAKETAGYQHMRWCIDQWMNALDQGQSFHDAIKECSWGSLIELRAFVKIGEESGLLVQMIEKAGNLYKQRARKDMALLVALLQPLLLLLLGGLIGLFIFALYMPLLSLGDAF